MIIISWTLRWKSSTNLVPTKYVILLIFTNPLVSGFAYLMTQIRMAKTPTPELPQMHSSTEGFVLDLKKHPYDVSGHESDYSAEDWIKQEELLSKTLRHRVSKCRPPAASYRRTFLKHLIAKFENDSSEVHDDFYAEYTKLLQEEDTELCFKTYTLPDRTTITLQESTNLISGGTTGLNTWQAAQYLSEWGLENKDIFTDKCVLELGSGLGLTGLTVIKQSDPRRYFFSDCHGRVLSLLRQNIRDNVSFNGSTESVNEREAMSITRSGHAESGQMSITRCGHAESGQMSITRCGHAESGQLSGEQCPQINGEHLAVKRCEHTHRERSPVDKCEITDGIHSDTSAGICPVCRSSDTSAGICPVCRSSDTSAVICPVCRSSDTSAGICPVCRSSDTSAVICPVCRSRGSCVSECPRRHLPEDGLSWKECDGDGVSVFTNIFSRNIEVWELNWESVTVDTVHRLTADVDVIIAADVVYDTSIVPALVKVLSAFLHSDLQRRAYVASTVRNIHTRDQFIQALEARGISCSVEKEPQQQIFFYDRSVPIEILKLQIEQ